MAFKDSGFTYARGRIGSVRNKSSFSENPLKSHGLAGSETPWQNTGLFDMNAQTSYPSL